jgi:hypothetical protein
MKVSHHVAASLPLGLAVKLTTGSTGYGVAATLASILIDFDHIPDYLIARGGWFGIQDFLTTWYHVKMDKVQLVLHAWEIPILLCGGWLLGIVPAWLAAIGLGIAYHLVFDQICNKGTMPGFYWFIHRAAKGFAASRLFCQEELAVLRNKPGRP